MDSLDERLLALLKQNARMSVSHLARQLDVSRTTVQDRLARLEDKKIITGYTVKVNDAAKQGTVRAYVMLKISPKAQDEVVAQCKKIAPIMALYTIAGAFDMAAMLVADNTHALDEALDVIGKLSGVERTQTSVLLSTKIEKI